MHIKISEQMTIAMNRRKRVEHNIVEMVLDHS